MLRLFIRILASALTFAYVLPLINGISFHGGLLSAAGLAILFGVLVWIVDAVAIALSAFLTIGTLGLALLWLVPLWLLGFWLLPAVALKLLADFVPGHIAVSGWTPAILGGLVLMFVGMLTSDSMLKTFRR